LKQKLLSPKVYSKEFSSRHPSFKKNFQKLIKSLPNWIQIPTPIHFSSLCCRQGISVPRMALRSEVILVSISLYFSSIKSLYSNHPSVTQEVVCLSPCVMLFYNQVLLLTCQGHTFSCSTTSMKSPDHFFFIYTLFPLFIPFT
jgi:hypothetical protein